MHFPLAGKKAPLCKGGRRVKKHAGGMFLAPISAAMPSAREKNMPVACF